MRRVILIIILSFLTFSSGFSQVQELVKQKFERMYPYAVNPQWQTCSNGYTVIYVGVKNLKYVIKYDTAGEMTNQFRELMPFEIPPFISANQELYEGKKLWSEKTDSGKIKYYVQEKNSFNEISPIGKNNREKSLSQR
jgi:hypothetical protein